MSNIAGMPPQDVSTSQEVLSVHLDECSESDDDMLLSAPHSTSPNISDANRLGDIRKGVKLDGTSWYDSTRDDSSSIRFCHIISAPRAVHGCNPVSLAFTVVVNKNLSWQLFVGAHLLDVAKLACLSSIPSTINGADDINQILKTQTLSWQS